MFPTIPFTKIADQNGNMTIEFQLFISQLLQLLNAEFGDRGIFTVPAHTNANIAQLFADGALKNGTIVYDSSNNLFKGIENDVLKTFTLV
jgi:hypothetical protein